MQTARHLLNSREILSISRALRALLNVQHDQNILQKESTDLSANNLTLALGGFHERCFAIKKPSITSSILHVLICDSPDFVQALSAALGISRPIRKFHAISHPFPNITHRTWRCSQLVAVERAIV